MNNSEMDVFSLFAGERVGENEPSDHTPRTQETGDSESAFDAGKQETKLREEEFRALMEGEYKELFTAYFQQTFNRRFKEYKQIKAELDSARAVMGALHERFGDLTGDALLNAIRANADFKNAPTEAEKPAPATDDVSVGKRQIDEACAEAERRVLSHIRARGMRPAENGVQVAHSAMPDVAKMTRAERAELAKRVERGERIVF